MSLTSGETFAGYTVAQRLSYGATGEVYLVQDPASTRWVALRVLSPALSTDDDFRQRFLSGANLDHPHIVQEYARGEFDGRLWVAMEYVDGHSAAQAMADRFPAVAPTNEVLAIVSAVASALDYGHERGMLHRDVKPANILLAKTAHGEPRVLLADFGIAPLAGTANYAAPEMTAESTDADPEMTVDGRADEYALAATAYHLLTGTLPGAMPANLSEQRPELERLDGVFAKALSRRPADRFDSCGEFADAAQAAGGLSTTELSQVSPEAAPVVETVPADDDHSTSDLSDLADDAGRHGRHELTSGPLSFESSRASRAKIELEPTPEAVPPKRGPRKLLVGLAALATLAGLLGLVLGKSAGTGPFGSVIRTKTANAGAPASGPQPNQPNAPAGIEPSPPGPPAKLDGIYRLSVMRSKQTFNYQPVPNPPDVNTFWAFRSSCAQGSCRAAAVQLDDNEHKQAKAVSGRPINMRFVGGQWESQVETVPFPCIGADGVTRNQLTRQVLMLRPNQDGSLVGEMEVGVHSNECGQNGAMIRIPAAATHSGDTPSGVFVPDPMRGFGSVAAGPGQR